MHNRGNSRYNVWPLQTRFLEWLNLLHVLSSRELICPRLMLLGSVWHLGTSLLSRHYPWARVVWFCASSALCDVWYCAQLQTLCLVGTDSFLERHPGSCLFTAVCWRHIVISGFITWLQISCVCRICGLTCMDWLPIFGDESHSWRL